MGESATRWHRSASSEQKKPKQQVVLSELPAEAAELPEQKKSKKPKQDRKEGLILLRVQTEQGAPLSTADYHKVYCANVKDAGGKQAHKQRRAAIKAQARAQALAKTKLRAAIKAQARARALAKTKLWRKQMQQRRATAETEQDGRNMAAQVLAKLAEPGMKKTCLDSIASGHNHVQVCAEAIRKYEKDPTLLRHGRYWSSIALFGEHCW